MRTPLHTRFTPAALLAVSMLTAALLASCSASSTSARLPEITPTERLLARPLPAGVAETALAVSTASEPDAGAMANLLWIVATDTREYQYPIATCRETRLTESDPDALATAECDGQRYVVRQLADCLELRRDDTLLAFFSLPTHWRTRPRSP
jgi:hypothetical protein